MWNITCKCPWICYNHSKFTAKLFGGISGAFSVELVVLMNSYLDITCKCPWICYNHSKFTAKLFGGISGAFSVELVVLMN
ncbi:hypothetical protein DXA21_21715, partial [Parabacteroides distasonis]